MWSSLACSIRLATIQWRQDDDLLGIAANWVRLSKAFSGLIYGHQLGLTIGQAIGDLELIAQVLSPEEMRNQIFWIPL